MRTQSIHRTTWILGLSGLLVAVAPAVRAQMGAQGNQHASPTQSGVDSLQTELHMLTDVQKQGQGVDKREFADYKAFYNENQELAKKIQLGKTFLAKYPKSSLTEAVDAGLVSAYVARQDWPNMYSTADSALALKPDDVDVLTTVGWVIPHEYRPEDPDADALLSKAENYEKHAIDVLAKMPKPSGVSDQDFTKLKTEKSLQAHSALGLVYFRRDDFDASARELQEATQGNANADQTDLYVLGMDLQNLKRYSDSAEAFSRCAQISGGVSDTCKLGADQSKRLSQIK
jgi:tetratricopeptide (TPR) repeat protein